MRLTIDFENKKVTDETGRVWDCPNLSEKREQIMKLCGISEIVTEEVKKEEAPAMNVFEEMGFEGIFL